MGISEILTSIDHEISRLEQARAILSGGSLAKGKRPVGRPRKSLSVDLRSKPGFGNKKRNLTPEGRRRIAEAVKRRWAAQRKAAAGK